MADPPAADRDLLDRFLRTRDEAAFAELVRRHAPGVWGACRRRLDHVQDAEDAFQAAFLVLVRRAGRLRAGTPLGPWLGKVAALTARNVLRGNRRRAAVAGPLGHDVPAAIAPEPAVDLDAALGGLPEADRTAVVLCHLDGLSRKEAAERLGCPEGTLSARLSRALGKLRARLADEVPAGLVRTTVRAVVVAGAAGSAGVSPAVARLAEEALRMVWVKKLTAAGLVLAAAGMVGLGVTRTADAGGRDKGTPAAKADDPADVEQARRELHLDALMAAQQRPEELRRLLDELLRWRSGAAKADKPAPDRVAELEARVKELEEALKQSRADNVRLQVQSQEVTRFLGESLAPPVGMDRGDPPAGAAKPADPTAPMAVAPAPVQPATPTAAELERVAEHADAAVKAADARAAQARERQQRVQEQLRLARIADQKERAAPEKDRRPDLRLLVGGDGTTRWGSRFRLDERTAAGPLYYGASSPAALARLLARAKADPNGPKTVGVEADDGCKPEDIRAALVALKAAGYVTVSYTGPLEGDLLGAAKGPGAWVYDKAKRYTGPIDLADLGKGAPASEKK